MKITSPLDLMVLAFNFIGVGGLLVGAWYASRIATQVRTLISNHIPHLQQEVAELRRMFVRHLERHEGFEERDEED